MKITTPPDIERYVRRKRKKEIFTCIVYMVLIAVVVFFPKQVDRSTVSDFNQNLFRVLLILVPPLFMRIPFKYLERSYCGEIIEVKTYRQLNSRFEARNKKTFITDVIVRISDTGELKKCQVFKTADTPPPKTAYMVGDKVIHIKGTKFLQVPLPSRNGQLRCVVCGSYDVQDNEKCHFCGHTLNVGNYVSEDSESTR